MPIRILSSMATKQVLADLVARYPALPTQPVAVESVGGVDAAKRVQAGEALDVVVLAAKTIDELIASGKLLAGSRVDLVRSGIAIAVRAGAAQPAIETEADVRAAVLAASSISTSTGPSGVYLAQLFARWGIAEQIQSRMVQAPPGVPVGSLVASGQVALGFQQLSELMVLPGITVLGPMPEAIQSITTFSAGISANCPQVEAVQALLGFMAAAEVAGTKRKNGMEPT